jgi:transcription antitermination factor NusG
VVVDYSEWYIIELSEYGDAATYSELIAATQSVFGKEAEYFIPIHHEQMGSYFSTNILFEGYIFVKDSEEVRKNLIYLKDCRIFNGLLKMCGKTKMLSSRAIGGLRKKLKNSLGKKYKPGVRVKINEGVFQNLEGEIQSMEDNGKVANVKIVCISREILAPIPTTCLEEIK